MVRKPSAPKMRMSIRSRADLLMWSTSAEEMKVITDFLKGKASEEAAVGIWYTEQFFGKARAASVAVPDLELDALQSLDDCLAAMNEVLAAQQSGAITEEHAESFRKTIAASASILRSKAGETLLESLEDADALPFFGPAQRGEAVAAFTDFMAAQEKGE